MKHAWFLPLWLLMMACGRPHAEPTFEARLSSALAEGPRPVTAYAEGFRLGARMVDKALRDGRRPYLPSRQFRTTPLPQGVLPEGVSLASDPAVELDPATGLEFMGLGEGAAPDWAQGQVDGFRWALARVGSALVKPRSVPTPPSDPEAWVEVAALGHVTLVAQDRQAEAWWREGLLGWRVRVQGFAPTSHWRRWWPDLRPLRVALGDDALWVETGRGLWALDLELGVIRAKVAGAAPRPADPMAEDGKARAEAAARARPALLAKAAQGDADAMVDLGMDAEDLAEEVAWYRRAADAGSAEGMYHLAVCCFQGRGVAEDKAEARRWFQKAAQAGHAGAREALAGLFPAP